MLNNINFNLKLNLKLRTDYTALKIENQIK